MNIAALVVGLIGGLISLLIGFGGFLLGGAFDAKGLMVFSLLIPIIGLVGAGFALSRHHLGGALMLLSAVAGFAVFGVHILSILPGALLIVAGLLALGHASVPQGTAPSTTS